MNSMIRKASRLRVAIVASAAFMGGLAVSSGFNLTPFGHAQQQQAQQPAERAIRPLNEQSDAFVAIAEKVTPGVVSIQTRQTANTGNRRSPQRGGQLPPNLEQFFDQFGVPQEPTPREGAGSGFIVSTDGYILTNNHVVAGAERVTVALEDKRVFDAEVIGRDPSTDVALIKIDAKDLPTLALGNDDNVRVGEWVLAIGNPLALDFTVTAGIVSAKTRSGASLRGLFRDEYAIVDYIQTDAAINPGNSGGPLVNSRGEVIGINSAIASPTGTYAGYGFAIPITLAKNVMDDLIEHGRVRRAVLGVSITDVTPEDAQGAGLKEIRGAMVQGFSPDGPAPAREAGLQPGDVIIAINGKQIDRVSELQRIVRNLEPGETANVDAMRYGDRKSFRVKLAEAAPVARVAEADRNESSRSNVVAYDKIGLTVAPLSAEQARQASIREEERGVMVTDVDLNGPAYGRIGQFSVITQVLHPQAKRVRTVSDLESTLSAAKKGDIVSLLTYDLRDPNKQTRVVNIRVGE
jgi:serine protease Do